MRIACATDTHYAPFCAAMLQSVLTLHPGKLTVHLLHDALPAPLLERFRALVARGHGHFEPLTAPHGTLEDLPRMDRIPPLMWLRCLLPELLPDADRVLYLDVDTLAVQPLDELWLTPLDDVLVAAVDNVLHETLRDRPAQLGLPSDARYFNSGVLLMNLESMRRDRSSDRLLDCARTRGGELHWPDQDALNIVLGHSRLPLHPRWNCQNSFFYWHDRSMEVLDHGLLDEALRSPALLHFEGPGWAKPWHFLSDHPYRDVWRSAQRATGWPLPRPRGVLRNVLHVLPAQAIGVLRNLAGYPRPQPSSIQS